MPEIKTENMERIAFHVPAPLLQEASEMCELEGWKLSEFHRMCWESGLAVQAEKSNKRLVNKGLRAKHQNKTEEERRNTETLDRLKRIVKSAEDQGLQITSQFLDTLSPTVFVKKNPVISGDEPDQT